MTRIANPYRLVSPVSEERKQCKQRCPKGHRCCLSSEVVHVDHTCSDPRCGCHAIPARGRG